MMAPEAKLIFRTQAGAKIGELVGDAHAGDQKHGGFWSLQCRREVNAIEGLTWTMALDHNLIPEIYINSQVEFWQRDLANGIDWYKEFDGIYRTTEAKTTDHDMFIGRAYDPKMILMWRHVAYPADRLNRSFFPGLEAETIMKILVQFNCTIDGTLAGDRRIKDATYFDGAINGFTVAIEADAGSGLIIDWYCAQDNLLETLQKLARIGGGDFDVIKTSGSIYEFRFYLGQRGTNRSDEVMFSTTYDNMVNPHYRYDHLNTKTSIIVGGQGQGNARTFVTVGGSYYHNRDNDIEIFIASTNLSAQAALESFGAQKADKLRERQELTFDVRQAAKYYGRDYFLGDIVRAVYEPLGYSSTYKINALTIDYKRTGERDVKPELRDELTGE